jgi:hypothetical protein
VGNDSCKCGPESIDIFTLDSDHLKTVAGERAFQAIALQVFGWMPSDGDVIVIDDDLHVQALCNGQASRLGVVTFLLRSIGAKAEDGLVAIGKRDAIDHGPQMSEASGREFDAWRKAELGVAWKLRIGGAIVQEVIHGEVTFQRGEEVLSCNAVA